MYEIILYGGVILAGIVGLVVTVMALPPTLRDLRDALVPRAAKTAVETIEAQG